MPRLSRFYGPAPCASGDWMDLPVRWLHAHQVMMNRIKAEEALARVSVIAAGNGLMDKQDQREYLDGLRRTMYAGRGPRVEKATVASLASMHISVQSEATSPGGVVLPIGVHPDAAS